MKPQAVGIILLLLVAFGPPGAVAPAVAQAPEEEVEPMFSCADCHEQGETFHSNPHARGRVRDGAVPNRVCESCHGDGTEHMEAGGDPDAIFLPRGVLGADSCLRCHSSVTSSHPSRPSSAGIQHESSTRKTGPRPATLPAQPTPEQIAAFAASADADRGSGAHANSDLVNCLTCHSIHDAEPRVASLLVDRELSICSTCHSTQAASFHSQRFAHRIGRGGMECSSCHQPHGRTGRDNLRTTPAGGMPCLSCHSAMRGPHVFPHGAAEIGDCLSCHEAHGSPNPKQLKRATVAQLCMECHSPITMDTLGSQPPSFHNLSNPRYRNCTTCHVAIHGSNRSPQLLK
jgi:DmsE family decaheme c-type cytochrome